MSPAEELMEAVLRNRQKPAKQRLAELVARGAIDRHGNVLIKGPSWKRRNAAEPDSGPPRV